MLEKAEELLYQMQLQKMAQYQALFGFIKPRLKSILEKVKLKTHYEKTCGSSSSSKVSVENKDNDDNQGDSGLGIEQDYHDEIDHEKYENYFETQICKNVSKNSARVIDNASYHSKYFEDHPKSTWKKAQYAEWLKKKKDHVCKRCSTTKPMEAGKRKAGELPCTSVGKNCLQIWT